MRVYYDKATGEISMFETFRKSIDVDGEAPVGTYLEWENIKDNPEDYLVIDGVVVRKSDHEVALRLYAEARQRVQYERIEAYRVTDALRNELEYDNDPDWEIKWRTAVAKVKEDNPYPEAPVENIE